MQQADQMGHGEEYKQFILDWNDSSSFLKETTKKNNTNKKAKIKNKNCKTSKTTQTGIKPQEEIWSCQSENQHVSHKTWQNDHKEDKNNKETNKTVKEEKPA